MLSDFLLLEEFFGRWAAVLYYEDLLKAYGARAVQRELDSGHVTCRAVPCGPGRGRVMFWLTAEGRRCVQA